MDPTPDRYAIEAEGVTKTYTMGTSVRAVDDVTLTIPHGAFVAVMGPSGSGKSTLMQLIGLLDAPTSGRIRVNGHAVEALGDVERTRVRGQEIGFVFQAFNLMPKLSVLDNVTLPMTFQGVPTKARSARATELLGRMGMAARLRHKPSELSGGERQRVAIARALANDPSLILADEPTGNLDSKTGEEVLRLFDELHRAGSTILVVTHERYVAERAQRIVHMQDGRVREVEELRMAPTPGAGAAAPRPEATARPGVRA